MSLWDPIERLFLYLTHPFPSLSLSCHPQGCVSSAVWASRCSDPSGSCWGVGDYYNPTLPFHCAIIIIIVSPNRSMVCSDGEDVVLNVSLMERKASLDEWPLINVLTILSDTQKYQQKTILLKQYGCPEVRDCRSLMQFSLTWHENENIVI